MARRGGRILCIARRWDRGRGDVDTVLSEQRALATLQGCVKGLVCFFVPWAEAWPPQAGLWLAEPMVSS
ncbi:hypothetical protein Ais01nite_54300 [Asanoa ishikariensis]|uniref:Uncharacterized protein n=1 Tax=Asanoa ishikariensis TaxID=137265 RepID=A0A1H3TUW7_9ACTN|nr:hypothetical protein Ais01nite_54300 [Asanoa ishikariensis]SDZ53039.1 hypothetical protein SAMN05421684_6291 [Asanoa ishikariensis]